MKITLDEVRRIAGLAQLRFSDVELERLRGQLDQILRYMDRLGELETDGVEPFAGVVADRVPALRPDEPMATLRPEEALADAPDEGHQHFKVPKVIP